MDNAEETTQQEKPVMLNGDLVQRFNMIQRVKPHFTVPKIKLALNRNMSRIQRALEPFQSSEEELREEYEIGPQQPLRDEDGRPADGVDPEFLEERGELLSADGEPYDAYTVPESLLDNEPGQMQDGRAGMPDGAITAVLWMFEE